MRLPARSRATDSGDTPRGTPSIVTFAPLGADAIIKLPSIDDGRSSPSSRRPAGAGAVFGAGSGAGGEAGGASRAAERSFSVSTIASAAGAGATDASAG